jgi:DoxX-like family
MFVASAIVSLVLAAALAFAAIRKFSHRPEVVRSYNRVGVPEERLNLLALILLAAAAGLVVGLWWAPLGIAAAVGAIVYFALALAAHIRASDLENIATPAIIELFAVASLALRLTTL